MKITLIEQSEERLRQAMLKNDVLALEELIADEVVFTTHTGELIDKQTDLEAHRSDIQKLVLLQGQQQRVQLYGNTAVVTVKMEVAGTFEGKAFVGIYRYTRVWVQSQPQGNWQVVAGHVSQVID
ncbi:nuclear transport factor 2 family protein [Komarekiella sp. 'clone 1']|uniref:Nuclear transport factor 2 family protein n=1 Tax=Komarekiella delphini-convector SJRDD-AB1 TaxID=2593771 RepID=A0AA40VV98_9NOST|nr:nuclear transport factor 2 family protein [Komarekiella delphini-convector]MBD6620806.1 nuclear transport factor 2 family protein [Komarekiella delphini-convector SJRDD-AB1]